MFGGQSMELSAHSSGIGGPLKFFEQLDQLSGLHGGLKPAQSL